MNSRRILIAFILCLTVVLTVVAQAVKKPLTNADVQSMLEAGLTESTVILAVQQSSANFDTSPQALIQLKNKGAGPKLLEAMIQAQTAASARTNSSTQKEPSENSVSAKKPLLENGSYRVTVESLIKRAHNYTAVLMFENLTKLPLRLQWIPLPEENRPFLEDERGNKYFVNGTDSEKIITNGRYVDLLPATKLKSTFIFYGDGGGSTFILNAREFSSSNQQRAFRIPGIKVTKDEDAAADLPVKPTFVTESYRAFVESAVRSGEDVILTILFENLSDDAIEINWGDSARSFWDGSWTSKSPYLIDESGDRYYLKKPDLAKIADDPIRGAAEILKGTKLRTELTFRVPGSSRTFTLATRERRPKDERPIVIAGIKIE